MGFLCAPLLPMIREPCSSLRSKRSFTTPRLCCGKRSTLWSAALSADPHSLKDLGTRVQGRYSLGDGRRVTITVEFVPSSSINPSQLLAPLMRGQAALLEWKSHLYV